MEREGDRLQELEEEEEEEFIPAEGPNSEQPGAVDLRISEFSLAGVIQQIENIRHFINTALPQSEPQSRGKTTL